MKKYFLIAIIIGVFAIPGCEKASQDIKHIQSSIAGLDRIVTLYNAQGLPIKTWEGKFRVETQNGVSSFVLHNKTIIINGTYTIEEQ